MLAASEPAPGSVRVKAEVLSPRTQGTTYFCFCASVPYLRMGKHMLVWPETDFATGPLARARASTART